MRRWSYIDGMRTVRTTAYPTMTTRLLTVWVFALVLGAYLLGGGHPVNAADPAAKTPVVVELYTSQGCSSCPPADQLLAELATDETIVALSLHVDYWDYIGWQDPFSDPLYTDRQRAYLASLSNRFIYTPQIIVDGRWDVVGSRRNQVREAIEKARGTPKIPIVLERERLTIPAGHAPDGGATIWMAFFDQKHETEVRAGENNGRKITNAHVVRKLVKIGEWNGAAVTMDLNMEAAIADGRDGCAVLLQSNETGPIIGAALLPFRS
ncbi:DUF1223 domain-containing protein [Limibacillus sp. MBR-115]|uniref:DUF1223 domain-containing protein n=1 Tax=Limibacillus sp. MBR-115 TaxID=3156465 RepID=UPI0033971EFD